MPARPLTTREAERARDDANLIWQGEWKHRTILFVSGYAGAELALMALYDTQTYDTPVLMVSLALMSLVMWWSHRRWFGKLETDLASGEVEQIEGLVVFPPRWMTFLFPSLRYTVQVSPRRLTLRPGDLRQISPGSDVRVAFLSRSGLVVLLEEVRV